MYNKNNVDTIILEVKRLTNDFQDILDKNDAINLGIFKQSGNGSGDRQQICKIFYTTYIYNGKTLPRTYPNYYIPSDLDLFKDKIDNFKNKCSYIKGTGIIGFIIHQLNTDKNNNRPIRDDIKKHYQQIPCVVCNSKSNLICDHKNDLYNDPRVLNSKTQTLDDFQSLCNSCNLRKRAISNQTILENKRFGATRIKQFEIFGIDYIVGDETFDKDDINAMVGTYWYDPVYFMKCLKDKINYSQQTTEISTIEIV